MGLIDSKILGDWIKVYDTKGKAAVQDTYPRKSYMLKEKRIKELANREVIKENERLKAEIEYLKKSQSLMKKLEGVTNREKSRIITELRTRYRLEDLLEIAEIQSSVYYYNVSVEIGFNAVEYMLACS